MFIKISILSILPFAILSNQAPISTQSVSQAPVISSNFPDPSIIEAENIWYAFSTNSGGRNVPIATSADFETWATSNVDALPSLGAWAAIGAVWAPDVVQLPDSTFVLYYSALSKGNPGTHCVGAAKSKNVQGPYTPEANPLACPISQGGAIDPAGFADSDGRQYVVYKVDGNRIGHGGSCQNTANPIVPTPIMLQEVEADGVTLIGQPTELLDRDSNDGPLIEAPSLVRVGDTYVLFFSSDCFTTSKYDVSYATSINGVHGPYTKAHFPIAPLLVTGSDQGKLYAPGGLDVAANGKNVVFHADLGTTTATRQMWTGEISVNGLVVTI